MAVPVATYITYAKIAQQADASQFARAWLRGGVPSQNYVRLLYIVRKAVQWAFTNIPTDSGLEGAANFMLDLSGVRLAAAPVIAPLIIITQPVSQTVNNGASVTFSVAAGGGITPYTYQWYFNSVLINGATSASYTISAAGSSNVGSYYCVVTDSSVPKLTATSNSATLAVNAANITAYASAQATDPYPTISGGADPFTYGYSISVAHNASLPYSLTAADNNKFFIFKIPVGEQTKVNWYNTQFNNGQIPDQVMRAAVTIGNFVYIVTRVTYAYDPTQLTTLS